jgi:hypothetical protein
MTLNKEDKNKGEDPMKITHFLKTYAMAVVGLSIMAMGTMQCYAQDDSQNTALSTAQKNAWKQNHPRRVQVNQRLKNQNKRINQGVKKGTLTQAQATQLKTEDQQIRQEEKTMASTDGSHITKADQKALNQQENAVSKQINQEKHPQ